MRQTFLKNESNTAARVSEGTRRLLLFILLFFLCSSFALRAEQEHGAKEEKQAERQESDRIEEQVVRVLEEKGYSSESAKEVGEFFADLEEKNIPGELLFSRVQEGAAKRVPIPRLIAVLEKDREYLQRARELFRKSGKTDLFLSRKAQWQRAANMLAAGFEDEVVRELIRLSAPAPEKFRPVSLLFVSLSQWGLSRENGLRVAEALVVSNIPPNEYEGVIELYRSARRKRMRPSELTDRIVSTTGKVDSLKELERVILR